MIPTMVVFLVFRFIQKNVHDYNYPHAYCFLQPIVKKERLDKTHEDVNGYPVCQINSIL